VFVHRILHPTDGDSAKIPSMIKTLPLLVCLLAAMCAQARELAFPRAAVTDDAQLAAALPALAKQALAHYRHENQDVYLSATFRMQLIAGDAAASVATSDQWIARHVDGPGTEPAAFSLGTRLYARARARQDAQRESFDDAYRATFRAAFAQYDDRRAYDAAWSMGTLPAVLRRRWQPMLDRQKDKDTIALDDAVRLISAWADYESSNTSWRLIEELAQEDHARRYIVEPDVLIRTKHGATLSAIVVRSRKSGRQPTALQAVIQTIPSASMQRAKLAASRGYVGVNVDTRGKRLSPDEIVLFEKDAKDMWGVIDWISKQPWSDGQVGMYGGSNAGFPQWAAAKTPHPALKTIVPYCPLEPGYGLPMENNVFSTANYDVFFEMGNKVPEQFQDRARIEPALKRWYEIGRPFSEIDQIDGMPNPWLQKYLKHPAFDSYWQAMTAYGEDYRKLDIPILAIDGYYDDGQSNAVRHLRDHYRYRPDAEHYLVIGPYDHFAAQAPWKPASIRGYTVDPVAQLDTPELTFQWFDYVMKKGPKPVILKNKINYQVMGANEWRSAPSIEAMSNEKLTLHLNPARSGDYYTLSVKPPTGAAAVTQRVDFADRTTTSFSAYPGTVLSAKPDFKDAQLFVSEPFDAPATVSGLFSARLRVILNKKDTDIAMALYEITPSNQFFHLSWTVQRASFAKDMTKRQLLVPNMRQTIPLDNTHLVSRQLNKGSRLLVALTINRSPDYQINYGTGRDVSAESIADAKQPLVVQWLGESTVTIPISR
jgi:putative CocE/NonD family hydrolase